MIQTLIENSIVVFFLADVNLKNLQIRQLSKENLKFCDHTITSFFHFCNLTISFLSKKKKKVLFTLPVTIKLSALKYVYGQLNQFGSKQSNPERSVNGQDKIL